MAEQEKTKSQETVTAQDSILSPEGDYDDQLEEEIQQTEEEDDEMPENFMTIGAMPLIKFTVHSHLPEIGANTRTTTICSTCSCHC